MSDETPETTQADSQDSFASNAAELTDGRFGEADAPEGEQTDSDVSEQPPASAEPQRATPPPQRQPKPTPPPAQAEPTFKLRGRTYTMAQIAARPDLVEDLVQTYEQFPHVQKLYNESLQRREEPAPEQAPPEFTPDQTRQVVQADLEQAVKAGHIEPEFAAIYPQVASEMMAFRNMILEQREKFENFISGVSTVYEQQTSGAIRGHVERTLTSVAGEGGLFADLAQPERRKEFLLYLIQEVNPKARKSVV